MRTVEAGRRAAEANSVSPLCANQASEQLLVFSI